MPGVATRAQGNHVEIDPVLRGQIVDAELDNEQTEAFGGTAVIMGPDHVEIHQLGQGTRHFAVVQYAIYWRRRSGNFEEIGMGPGRRWPPPWIPRYQFQKIKGCIRLDTEELDPLCLHYSNTNRVDVCKTFSVIVDTPVADVHDPKTVPITQM